MNTVLEMGVVIVEEYVPVWISVMNILKSYVGFVK